PAPPPPHSPLRRTPGAQLPGRSGPAGRGRGPRSTPVPVREAPRKAADAGPGRQSPSSTSAHRSRRHKPRAAGRLGVENARMAEDSSTSAPPKPVAWTKPLRAPIEMLGELTLFFGQSVATIFRPPYRVGLLFNQ